MPPISLGFKRVFVVPGAWFYGRGIKGYLILVFVLAFVGLLIEFLG